MTYEPDEQDELIGDAMAVGGPAFVEAVHYAAMDAANEACPWDGDGEEPAEYRRAWLAAARDMIAERRGQLAATEARDPRRSDGAAPDLLPGMCQPPL